MTKERRKEAGEEKGKRKANVKKIGTFAWTEKRAEPRT